jgi:aspartyl-tRNA(Asn)/glutamyl-tRNA(Gln) amidotransferase subunit C
MSDSDSDSEIDLARDAARLARLEITDEEARHLGPQFARLLAQFRSLEAVDVEGVEPTTGATLLRDVRRADEPRTSPAAGDLLAGAPAREDGFYSVPKTLRES